MNQTLYQKDFYTWVNQQSNLLREGQFEQLDLPNLILLRRNPELKSRLDEAMQESWSEARDIAIAETDLPDDQFPETSPFSLEEVINPEFFSE